MDNQIQLKKELKILGFLIEMRKCYLEGKHKKKQIYPCEEIQGRQCSNVNH